MASSSPLFKLDPAIFNQALFDRIHDLWFAEQPIEARIPTEGSMKRWFPRGDDKQAAVNFDNDCRSLVLHALEALCSENIQLPEAVTWKDEQRDAAALAHPFMTRLDAADPAKKADNALSLTLLLDQMPRNIFRAEQKVIYTHLDRLSRALAHTLRSQPDRPDHAPGIRDKLARRMWFLIPYMHSEHLEDHNVFDELTAEIKADKSCNVNEETADLVAKQEIYEEKHVEIIRQFGRYPYRNDCMGRETTKEEQHWLDNGGERFTA